MNVFEMPVHETADIFPMIGKDELEELAEDIKENGLIHPIVVRDGVLIDGRNRREACRIAGITPSVTELDADDDAVKAYIISSNINRRHMTKGQQAMAVAMIYPEKSPYGMLKNSTFDRAYLTQARTVLKHLPDKADLVLGGSEPLSSAYKEAVDAKESAENGIEALKALRDEAPDLADLVVEERMTLQEARAALTARRQREANDRLGWWKILKDMDMNISAFTEERTTYLLDIYKTHSDECDVNLKGLIDNYISTLTELRKSL